MRYGIPLLQAVLVLALMGMASSASGSSAISMAAYSGSAKQGGALSVNYTVQLVNGTYGSTSVAVLDANSLTASNIIVHLNTGLDYPTFSGTMEIFPSLNTTPGQYTISLQARGEDPSGVANFTIEVLGIGATTTTAGTTVASTTAPAASSSTVATTSSVNYGTPPSSSQQSGGGVPVLYVAVIVAVVVIVVLYLVFSKRKPPAAPAQSKPSQ